MNPTTPNPTPFFGRKISQIGVNVTQATDNQLVLKEDYNQGNTIYYDQNGVAAVLIGLRPSTNIRGFYVSQSGIDVRIATDEQLIFNSQQDMFKIVLTNTVSLTIPATWVNGANLTATIPHKLSITPTYQVFCTVPNLGGLYPQEQRLSNLPIYLTANVGSGAASIFIEITASSDENNLYITINNSSGGTITGGSPPFVFRYYIQQETAN